MSVSVAIFNASTQAISVSVNLGPQIPLGQSGPDVDWAPAPQTPGLPTYQPGNPAPNVLGNLGANIMQAYLGNVPIGGTPFQFSIPSGTTIGSIQIYLFFETVQTASWLALEDGKPFAERVITSVTSRRHS